MAILVKLNVLVLVLFGCSQCNADQKRDRRFIILGDSNVGVAVSVGGSIGSGIISSSRFKGKSFTVKRWNVKKPKCKYNYQRPGMWFPPWTPPVY